MTNLRILTCFLEKGQYDIYSPGYRRVINASGQSLGHVQFIDKIAQNIGTAISAKAFQTDINLDAAIEIRVQQLLTFTYGGFCD